MTKKNLPQLFALVAAGFRTSYHQSLAAAITALRKSGADAIEEIGVGIVYARQSNE